MISIRNFISLLIVFCSSIEGYSQNFNQKNYSISVTVFNEKLVDPFSAPKSSPINIGGTLSFEISKPREGIYQFSHVIQLGYYKHNNFNQVAFLAWKPTFELKFFNLINLHTILGIGYAHSLPIRPSYVFENNTYIRKKNYGTPHLIPSIGFGFGLDLEPRSKIPLEIFSRYEVFSLAPYALNGRIPLTINRMIHFGVKFKL